MIRRLLAVTLLAAPLYAQEKPEAPKPKTDHRVFLAGVSLLAASTAADAITTRRNLDRGAHENNPVFGLHPSPVKQSLINLGAFAAESGALYVTEHNRRPWVRWAGRAFIGFAIVEHARLAACNAPGTNNCKPIALF